MYRITKEFHFSASHQLKDLPDDHPCARMHGHNYVVVIELAGEGLGATASCGTIMTSPRSSATSTTSWIIATSTMCSATTW